MHSSANLQHLFHGQKSGGGALTGDETTSVKTKLKCGWLMVAPWGHRQLYFALHHSPKKILGTQFWFGLHYTSQGEKPRLSTTAKCQLKNTTLRSWKTQTRKQELHTILNRVLV